MTAREREDVAKCGEKNLSIFKKSI